MSDTPSPSPPGPAVPLLPLGPLLHAIGDETRWRILHALSAGEPLMVTELAQAIGRSDSATAKHLAVLRKAGITKVGRGRLQQIAKPFLADPASGLVDLGYLQLHLRITEPSP